jgi:uroporphyrinogen-III synthase
MTGQFATVGAGTRDSLASYGVNNIIYPLTEVGSQALLETLAQEQVAGKHVVIFKGDSENDSLEEGLKARGAIIHPIICYERKHSQDSPQPLVHALENGHMDIIITTSGDGLKALVKLLPEFLHEALFKRPVVVVSDRIREIAKTLGFATILLAKDASDEAIVAAVEKGAHHD